MTWQVKQRVDFYLDEFHPPEMPKEIKQISFGLVTHLVVACLAVTGMWVFESIQHGHLTSVQQRDLAVTDRVQQIERERPSAKVSETLIAERDTARRELDDKRRILQYLTKQNVEKSHSFTNMVGGLSEQAIPGVWLSGFSILDKGQHLVLKGYADDPSKVSIYADDLLASEYFRRFAFRQVQVEKDPQSDWVKFYLSTRSELEEDPIVPTEPIRSRQLIGQLTRD